VACREEVRRSKGAAAAQSRGDCYLLRVRTEDRVERLVSSWLSARAAGNGCRAARI
jgi:hypothetical protein